MSSTVSIFLSFATLAASIATSVSISARFASGFRSAIGFDASSCIQFLAILSASLHVTFQPFFTSSASFEIFAVSLTVMSAERAAVSDDLAAADAFAPLSLASLRLTPAAAFASAALATAASAWAFVLAPAAAFASAALATAASAWTFVLAPAAALVPTAPVCISCFAAFASAAALVSTAPVCISSFKARRLLSPDPAAFAVGCWYGGNPSSLSSKSLAFVCFPAVCCIELVSLFVISTMLSTGTAHCGANKKKIGDKSN